MSKKWIVIIAIALVACFALALTGCESYKNATFEKGNGTEAESNSGMVVKQGGYVYFVNGYAGYSKVASDNYFGNALKGAILRIPEGGSYTDVEVIVPKTVMTSAPNPGFSIFGDYIYYVTPSTEEARDGSVLTNNIQFMRTGLDGQNTQMILEYENGSSAQYKYTAAGLVYVKDSKVYFKSTDAKKFNKSKDGEVLVEKYSSVYLPECVSPSNKLNDAVFYTVASESYGDYTNTLYVVRPGTNPVKLIDKDTFVKDAASATAYKDKYSISILSSVLEKDGGLTIFYTKSYYVGTSSEAHVAGVYAYKFTKNFAFDASKERQISTTTLSSIYPLSYNDGVLVGSDVLTLYTYDATAGKVAVPKQFKDDNGSISKVKVLAYVDGYIYYIASDASATTATNLNRYKLDGTGFVQTVASITISQSFAPEVVTVDGKDVFFFLNGADKNYVYVLTLDDYVSESLTVKLCGKVASENATTDDHDHDHDDHAGHNHD